MYAYMYIQKQNRIELVSPYGKWLQWLKKDKTKHGPLFIPNGNKSKSLALTLLAPLGRAFEKR